MITGRYVVLKVFVRPDGGRNTCSCVKLLSLSSRK